MLLRNLGSVGCSIVQRSTFSPGKVSTMMPARQCHLVSVPPRNKVSTAELVARFSVILVSALATPVWCIHCLRKHHGNSDHGSQ